MLGASFFFSAAMNYFRAIRIAVSPAGKPHLQRGTGPPDPLLSCPMIALPSLPTMVATLCHLARTIRELAGLKFADALKH